MVRAVKLVALLSSLLATLDDSHGIPARPVPGRNPVILVHGIHSDSRDMTRMAHALRREGWEVYAPNLAPADGRVGLDRLASQLAVYTERTLAGRRFDLVGFSMGGLVGRYYLQRLGGMERVDRFVTIASPHHGTVMANLNCGAGGRQMRRGSDFLRDLERDAERLCGVQFTSFYTPLDLIIIPAGSSEMPEASNIRICAATHPSLILEKRCIRAVAKALLAECHRHPGKVPAAIEP
ncbi:MAG: alpha/beta fold hydrolase [Verrucomicrobia bacterium]|nr:MAG: alpha/beta fold hydrolase [Verrucomicrobiota bacterium]